MNLLGINRRAYASKYYCLRVLHVTLTGRTHLKPEHVQMTSSLVARKADEMKLVIITCMRLYPRQLRTHRLEYFCI